MCDHNPLAFLHRMKNHNQRLMRWAIELQDYNLDVVHIKGSHNVIADTLSRSDWCKTMWNISQLFFYGRGYHEYVVF